MLTHTLLIEVPDDLVQLLGSPQEVQAKAKQALILALLREGRVSQGRAAELLGITRWHLIDLMAEHDIAAGPRTKDEVDAELDGARRHLKADAVRR